MEGKRYQIAKSYTVASKRYIIFSTNNKWLWDIIFYLYSKYYKNEFWIWGCDNKSKQNTNNQKI